MAADRYLKIVLTVIAVELAWIGLKDFAAPVSAQAQPQPTRVVIAGIEQMPRNTPPLTIRVNEAVPVLTQTPVQIASDRPLRITSDQPLRVDVVRAPNGLTPGM